MNQRGNRQNQQRPQTKTTIHVRIVLYILLFRKKTCRQNQLPPQTKTTIHVLYCILLYYYSVKNMVLYHYCSYAALSVVLLYNRVDAPRVFLRTNEIAWRIFCIAFLAATDLLLEHRILAFRSLPCQILKKGHCLLFVSSSDASLTRSTSQAARKSIHREERGVVV